MTNRSESTRSRAQDAGAGQVRDGVRRRERRIARSQVWDSARGSGVATPDPHPSAPSAGPVYLNTWPLGNPLGYGRSQIPRFPMIVDTLRLAPSLRSPRHLRRPRRYYGPVRLPTSARYIAPVGPRDIPPSAT